MDEYKSIFYDFRHLHGKPFGDISQRLAIRKQNHCQSFQWFLQNIAYDLFVPELHPRPGRISRAEGTLCLSGANVDLEGNPSLQGCAIHSDRQQYGRD